MTAKPFVWKKLARDEVEETDERSDSEKKERAQASSVLPSTL